MQATSEYAIITREFKERKVMITKEAYQLIRSHPAFAAIPVEKFDKLAVEIHHREIPKGQIIFFARDRRDRIFLLQEGYVRIEQFDSSDSFSYMDYIKEGALFPYGGMFTDETYHYTASAITAVSYFSIPVDLYEEYAQANVEQVIFITRELSKILEFQELRLRNVVAASASDRVIQSLALLCKDYRQVGNTVPFPMSMKELARLAATTRETVNLVLKKLIDEEKIQYKHKILTFVDLSFFLDSFEEA